MFAHSIRGSWNAILLSFSISILAYPSHCITISQKSRQCNLCLPTPFVDLDEPLFFLPEYRPASPLSTRCLLSSISPPFCSTLMDHILSPDPSSKRSSLSTPFGPMSIVECDRRESGANGEIEPGRIRVPLPTHIWHPFSRAPLSHPSFSPSIQPHCASGQWSG